MKQKINSWLIEAENNFNLYHVNNLVKEACRCYCDYVKKHNPKPLTGKVGSEISFVEVICLPRKDNEKMCDVFFYDSDKAAFYDVAMEVFSMDVTYFEKKLETVAFLEMR